MNEPCQCSVCGTTILPETAQRNGGLCTPCKGGYRESIEASQRDRAAERAYRQSAEFKFWSGLVRRAHQSGDGLQGLTEAEKTYFVVNSFVGDVYGDGFESFFSTASADRYSEVLAALHAIGAEASAALVVEAKKLIFADDPVPSDTAARMTRMRQLDVSAALEELDADFYDDPDSIDARCKQFARAHALYEDDTPQPKEL